MNGAHDLREAKLRRLVAAVDGIAADFDPRREVILLIEGQKPRVGPSKRIRKLVGRVCAGTCGLPEAMQQRAPHQAVALVVMIDPLTPGSAWAMACLISIAPVACFWGAA